jgi:hypothetical protein
MKEDILKVKKKIFSEKQTTTNEDVGQPHILNQIDRWIG